MRRRGTRGAAACATALVALSVMAALMAWAGAELVGQARAPGPASFDTLIGLLATACAAGCGGWLAVAALLTVLGSLPGAVAGIADGLARRITPTAWRRTIRLALGVALITGPVAAPAHAANVPTPVLAAAAFDRPGGDAEPIPDPAALPPIDRPAASTPNTTWTPNPPPAPPTIATPASPVLTGNLRPAAVVEDHVVVRRGDTLWHIAGRHLGPEADAAAIAMEWPRWWHANRDVIGPDPDLILPGQLLRPPA
jgi:resuscitation-promoting factor RpfA